MAGALAAGALACAWAGATAQAQIESNRSLESTSEQPAVTVAILPYSVEPEDLGRVEGLAPGVMSAGLSKVSPVQTYLDIGQGNRVFTSLYDREPPVMHRFGDRVPGWAEIVARAESAPADIDPGLLASSLREATAAGGGAGGEEPGIPVRADSLLVTPALIAADEGGRVDRTSPLACLERRCPGLSVLPATLAQLPGVIDRLRDEDLLIAIERAPPPERDTLSIGVAGEGFDGNLTSDTTRTEGFVLATDVAPTVLDRFGIAVPDEISGEPIRSEGGRDAAAVAERAGRMRVVAGRRSSVILDNLMIWAALALLASLLSRGRVAPLALSLLGLATVYLPLLLLVGAAADTNELAERLIAGLGAPALAALTLRLWRRWEALAIACAVTVAAYAIDVIAGSPLTAQSLLGPNPGLGVRFFGIGNELEATLSILTLVGIGAGLTAYAARAEEAPSVRRAAAAFLGISAVAALIFAAGRFGADVGAAIVFPAGAVVAAVVIPGALRGGRLLLALLAAPVIGLAALASIDLVLGGDAHLSRSVFEAGGADQLGDVFERRLRLSAASFNRSTAQPLFWFALLVVALVLIFRNRVLSWLAPVPLAGAGFAGATAAMLLGIVANDSGALFLIIGTIAMLACLAFAYAQHARSPLENRRRGV